MQQNRIGQGAIAMTYNHSNDLLIQRLREMPLSPDAIARAEADFHMANAIVDGAFDLVAGVRAAGARVARQLRSVFVPQH
jgi:hypothetical protein